MTLPELLICVVLVGLLTGVLSAALVVTFRQESNTRGRLNLSQAEQSVGMWMPNDLASAQTVTKNPGSSPCGDPVCDGIDLSAGSNVLMLSWTVEGATGTGTEVVTTNVSYHMTPAGDGETFELWRIECSQTGSGPWSCSSVTLLRDLPGPPAGTQPSSWVGGVGHGTAYCVPPPTTPATPPPCSDGGWVIGVSVPLAADATEDLPTNYATGDALKDANRVIVTIDGGGGDGGDTAGGRTRISITAGGTNRATIDANSLLGTPSFEEARSRCGGPLTLIVDESQSISQAGAGSAVFDAVRQFAQTLVGTPVQLQIVEFERSGVVLGATSGQWHRYYNMLDINGDVKRLLTDFDLNGVADNGLIGKMVIGDNNGDTNWEDALFRTFYDQNGGVPVDYPETVVFFTDGAPTADRQMGTGYKTGGDLNGQPSYSRPPYAAYSAGVYNQASFNRANYILTQNRARTRLIGVGVGGINDAITWVSNPGAGIVLNWERASGSYYKTVTTYQTNRKDFKKGKTFSSNLDYEKKSGSSWGDVTPNDYFKSADSNHGNENDNYRIKNFSSTVGTRTNDNTPFDKFEYAQKYVSTVKKYGTNNFKVLTWDSSSAAAYKAAPSDDERQYLYTYTSQGWTDISQADYNAGNWTADESDGFRTVTTYTWITQAQYNQGIASPQPGVTYTQVAKRWAPDNNTPALTEANAPNWEPVAAPYPIDQQLGKENNATDGYRATRSFPATPPSGGYAGYTTATTESKTGAKILANAIAGDDVGVPFAVDNTTHTDNAKVANMFVLPPVNQGGFAKLGPALVSIALGECGGTLTLQTKVTQGGTTTNARDPFRYQNTAIWDAGGTPMNTGQPVVKTSQQFPSGTFDFNVPGGTTINVEIRPSNYQELSKYTPQGWSCRAGITPITTFTTFPILDEANQPTGWTGIRVPISANNAVACELNVSL